MRWLYSIWNRWQRDTCRYCPLRTFRWRIYRHTLRAHLDQHITDTSAMLAKQARLAEEAHLFRLYGEIQSAREDLLNGPKI